MVPEDDNVVDLAEYRRRKGLPKAVRVEPERKTPEGAWGRMFKCQQDGCDIMITLPIGKPSSSAWCIDHEPEPRVG